MLGNMKKIYSIPATKATKGYVDYMISNVQIFTDWWIKYFSVVVTN